MYNVIKNQRDKNFKMMETILDKYRGPRVWKLLKLE
jgi:hypothetical protein